MALASEQHMPDNHWRVIVHSIGSAGAGLVSVLKKVSPLSENRIASLLYQAPSELLSDLSLDTAKEVTSLLQSAGLDCQAVDESYTFTKGEGAYEVALVIRDFSRMTDVLEQIVVFLGVNLETAKKIVCTSPTVLVGSISENTVAALKHRFEPLGVELDVCRPAEVLFDVFIGECPPIHRQQVLRIMQENRIATPDEVSADQPLLATGLDRAQAEKLWQKLQRASFPVRLVNRDFQRFDLCLDAAPDSPEMQAYLTQSTGMPEKVARKVPQKTPIVLQHNIRFADMTQHLEAIHALGGQASGHLLVFQTFSIKIETLGDKKAATGLLKFIAGYSDAQALSVLSGATVSEKPLTPPQARWLQAELKKAGTKAALIVHE